MKYQISIEAFMKWTRPQILIFITGRNQQRMPIFNVLQSSQAEFIRRSNRRSCRLKIPNSKTQAISLSTFTLGARLVESVTWLFSAPKNTCHPLNVRICNFRCMRSKCNEMLVLCVLFVLSSPFAFLSHGKNQHSYLNTFAWMAGRISGFSHFLCRFSQTGEFH